MGMGQEIIYTHKGWFGMCPVYLAGVETDCPDLDVRHWSLAWLLTMSVWMLGSMIWIRTAMDPLYDPEFPIVITGELPTPVVRHA